MKLRQEFILLGDDKCPLTGNEIRLYKGKISHAIKYEIPETGVIQFTEHVFATLCSLNEWQKKKLLKACQERKPEEIDRNFMNKLFGHSYAPEQIRF